MFSSVAGIKRKQLDDSEARRRAVRLGDLAGQGAEIFCWCNRCGHNAVLAAARLAAELGSAFPVPEIGARMRCSGCGSKDVATRPHWPGVGVVAHHGSAAAEPSAPSRSDDGAPGERASEAALGDGAADS